MISQKLLEQMIQKYGESKQLNILKEECAELIKAVSKYEREEKADDIPMRIKSVAEEEADLRIMLEQNDIIMLKHEPEYIDIVRCEMLRKEQRIRNTLLGIK
jgi:predicted ribosome-associated RNA-binding protein Tma20